MSTYKPIKLHKDLSYRTREWNFVDENNKILSNIPFDAIGPKDSKGWTIVYRDNLVNAVAENGRMLPTWYNGFSGFNQNGIAVVKKVENIYTLLYNVIDTDGNYISDTWFDYCDKPYKNVIRVCKDGQWNLLKSNGCFVFSNWVKYIGRFNQDLASFQINDTWNFISPDGEILSNDKFNIVENFSHGYSKVFFEGIGWNLMDKNTNFYFKDWWDNIYLQDDKIITIKVHDFKE